MVFLKIYNSLTKKLMGFRAKKDVNMYVCGPTVYNYAHIGNMRTYIFGDLIARFLEYKGYKVKYVRNYTDVDDKTIKGSIENGKSLEDFTNFYIREFEKDCSTLNLNEPDVKPRPTRLIKEIVEFIEGLIKDGYAYKAKDGSTYFDISKFVHYGKLNNIKQKELKKGASERVNLDEYEKDNASDFVLWKAWKEEDGKVYWNTSLGKGRPGWHIECSVMCHKYLGKTIDIHCGGEDLKFPHHENEIAQSEAHNNARFVNYWIHFGMLTVDGKKMSKRYGNIYTIREILEKGYNPIALKLYYFMSNYRSAMDFSFEELKETELKLNGFNKTIKRLVGYHGPKVDLGEYKKKIKGYLKDIEKAMDNDFNTRLAMTYLLDMFSYINLNITEGNLSTGNIKFTLQMLKVLDVVFGIFKFPEAPATIIFDKVKKRQAYRAKKDYAMADKMRDQLKDYMVEDHKNGAFSVYKN
ncbi:MAG: cysteine--tRNA ligase [Candidatus ainarchaeum sp.]|nr:cysteine--tRNA ligase [Candidatus ainarchaeum sp.]